MLSLLRGNDELIDFLSPTLSMEHLGYWSLISLISASVIRGMAFPVSPNNWKPFYCKKGFRRKREREGGCLRGYYNSRILNKYIKNTCKQSASSAKYLILFSKMSSIF